MKPKMAREGRPLVIGLGEVLWDLLPAGEQFGGAPANFAYHAHALGAGCQNSTILNFVPKEVSAHAPTGAGGSGCNHPAL